MSSSSLTGLQNLIPNTLDGLFNVNASSININGIPVNPLTNTQITFNPAVLPTLNYSTSTGIIDLNLPFVSTTNSGIVSITNYITADKNDYKVMLFNPLTNQVTTLSPADFYIHYPPPTATLGTLQEIFNKLQPHLNSYKNANFYDYILDGDGFQINDGGNDMYDGGNFTQIVVNSSTSANLSYQVNTPTALTVGNAPLQFVSLGYAKPLVMLSKPTSALQAEYGMSKSGNNGADGQGTSTVATVYNGATVNGFTVYAFYRLVSGAGNDPSIGDLYFSIGDNQTQFFGPIIQNNSSNTDSGFSSFKISSINALTGAILLSKPAGAQITVAECQQVIQAITIRL